MELEMWKEFFKSFFTIVFIILAIIVSVVVLSYMFPNEAEQVLSIIFK